jgi:hypothetical protein
MSSSGGFSTRTEAAASCFGFGGATPKDHAGGRTDVSARMEHPAVKEIDSLIAKEMYQLSMKEREKALDDIHGIGNGEVEDPNFVNSSLMELEQRLGGIKANSVYEEAEQLSEEFVRNPHFRVMFLRAENFDSRQAAERMLRFFTLKKGLFGRDKLVKKITLQDLDEDDLESLRAGEGQISSFRDAAGRPVVTFAQRLRKFKHIINVVSQSNR